MTIHLPKEIESALLEEIGKGRFASIEEALIEAWRVFQRERTSLESSSELGLIGALRDDAELLDQAVEHAMKVREQRPWRMSPIE